LLARVAPQRHLSLSRSALQGLTQYAFPGNVRELRNVLERSALLCDGTVIERIHIDRALDTDVRPSPASGAATGLPASPPEAAGGRGSAQSLQEIERQVLHDVLRQHQGSRAELARKLGISERSLYRKLHALGSSDA
jgi:DNA-binding NtrC family response regulator